MNKKKNKKTVKKSPKKAAVKKPVKKPAKKKAAKKKPAIKRSGKIPEMFVNATDAVAYLKREGYKVSNGKFYTDRKAGWVEQDTGKCGYSAKSITKYIKHLKVEKTLLKKKDEKQAWEESKEKTLKMQAERKLIQLKILKEEGKTINKDEAFSYIASLLSGVDNIAKGQFQTGADEAVELIMESDDPSRQFMEITHDILDRSLNEVAGLSSIEAMFGREE